jgi:type VI protein secretion system component Hcp
VTIIDATYLTQDREKIDVSSMSGPWMQISGREHERDVASQKPGVGEKEIRTRSKVRHGDVTVTKMFRTSTDIALEKRIAGGETFAGTTITVTGVDEDDNPIPGAETRYVGCSVRSCSQSDADVNGADPKTFSVTFAYTSVA